MKFSESWLREWVNPKMTRENLCEKLTLSGLEIESLAPVSDVFTGVVVGQVLRVEAHPEADRLHICEVNVAASKPLTIVCGATNVKPGMKVPVALEKAVLPHQVTITASKVRNVMSYGMLCSARDLGLAEESEGLFELPSNAPLGKDVWEYLNLSDYLIEVSITPNRGDCLSLMGIAKEVSALTESPVITHKTPEIIAVIQDVLPVTLHSKEDCPRYVGRVIRDVKADASSPMWLREHLRRSGVRSISPVVDVTNYIMLELGQPMHAFDLDQLQGGITVRKANAGESLKLLDGSEKKLTQDTVVIADQAKPLAIAGIMGGVDSSVTLLTKNIFLESAFFQPASIAKMGRHYNLGSESSYRFERGVDPDLQRLAIERATQLLLDIVGGKPGPVTEVIHKDLLPQTVTIELRAARISKILGYEVPAQTVTDILQRLGFTCEKNTTGWIVTVPPRRFDIAREIDLIEEVARLYGYEKIPCHIPAATLSMTAHTENLLSSTEIRRVLCDMGYQEVITYSFVEKKFQERFFPDMKAIEVVNPMTAEMDVMRVSLWPGLVNTLLYNLNRQQTRARLFEIGLHFIQEGEKISQDTCLSGLLYGSVANEQWGLQQRPVDFFDLKGDLQNLFKLTHAAAEFSFRPSSSHALHPGQSADVYRGNERVGMFGALHPAILQALKIEGGVYVFELHLDPLLKALTPQATGLSKFPEIRRDIAILVDQAISAAALQAEVRQIAGEWLKVVEIFDVYQGKGIAPGQKSIAISLTLQHSSRTLVDEEVANVMERVINGLKGKFNAELRG